ncbi:MAG TPA: endonuclease III [Candidatus Limnocylindria bacterium]|nr:endonuclease III [Candidatus Limnocylindria bacterium]
MTETKASGRPSRTRSKPRRKPADPVRTWVRSLARYRPGLVDDTLAAMRAMYGTPVWQRVHDPTSELVLTILSQNSADINAERAFDALGAHWPSRPPAAVGSVDTRSNRPGWGGQGIGADAPPDWATVAHAPLDELIEVIRPGGLAPQKAPTILAALNRIEQERGDYSLEFLGDLQPLDALAWLMSIPGIGRKTASVVLLFSFGMPLMPVDRHVERVSKRIGLLPPKATALQAHDYYLALLAPELAHEAHVNLITHGRQTCHALRPACGRCAVAARCRYLDRRAP